MKKIAIFIVIVIIILTTMYYMYMSFQSDIRLAEKENSQFEFYLDRNITGAEIVTLINMITDSNVLNEVEKNSENKYIDNTINSINMDIRFIDDDITYNIEKIFDNGVEKFLIYYGDIEFKSIEIQYHEQTSKIKYMLFEQITQ